MFLASSRSISLNDARANFLPWTRACGRLAAASKHQTKYIDAGRSEQVTGIVRLNSSLWAQQPAPGAARGRIQGSTCFSAVEVED